MKCDKREEERSEQFIPESPFVIVCEGYQDVGFVCALLKHNGIDHFDVTYPKKQNGGNGESGISTVVQYLDLVRNTYSIKGILVLRDADEDPALSFRKAATAFPDGKPKVMMRPTEPFKVFRGSVRTGVFLVPGKTKLGCLDHLLLEAAVANDPGGVACIESLCKCADIESWQPNKLAKARLAALIATKCVDDPRCSPAHIWKKKGNPIPIESNVFSELVDFIKEFGASDQQDIPIGMSAV